MDNKPSKVILEKGKKYFWCACGLTQKPPFCDGSHKGTGKRSLPFENTEQKEAWLCNCKKTKTPPFCDGSHKITERG